MQGTRILLLEDDRETRWALATVLRREGCRVTEAGNGEEGLKFLARNGYDLCISDVCMPGMGGFGFFAAVRFSEKPELQERRSMPMLFLSGKVATRELAQALDAGVDDFMEKPIDPEEFKARVRAVLRRASATARPSVRTAGDLADFNMGALAQALHSSGRNVRLRVQSGVTTAVIDFQRGSIKNAAIDGPSHSVKGDAAAIQALGIENGIFEIQPIPEQVPHTVFLDTPSLMLRAVTLADEVGKQIQDRESGESLLEDTETMDTAPDGLPLPPPRAPAPPQDPMARTKTMEIGARRMSDTGDPAEDAERADRARREALKASS